MKKIFILAIGFMFLQHAASAQQCAARFTIWPDSMQTGVYYGQNTTASQCNTTVSYLWSWGDGTTDSTTYPSHTYATPGTYVICLTIKYPYMGMIVTDSNCVSTKILRTNGGLHSVTILDPNAPSGINDALKNSALKLFPNPSTNELSIDLNNEIIKTVKLISMNGQTIIESNTGATKIDVSQLTSNIYFVEISTAKDVYRAKFIKE